MTVRERVIRGQVTSEHIVQFFDTAESRAACVAEFLADGIACHEPAIIVASGANWTATREQLRLRRSPVDQAIDRGMVVVTDATECLRRISRNGVPDAAAFDRVVGEAVRALARRGTRVRAYGEMVDILAERGEMSDAIALEGFWNQLGERTSFYLLCGYSAPHFVATAAHRAMRDICSAHSDVHRHEQDHLANWLLTSSHNAPRVVPVLH